MPSAWLIRKSRIVPRFTLRSALAALLLWLSYSVSASASAASAASASDVEVIHVDGVINAVSANYVAAAVARAGSERAGGLVVVLNTPGGLSTSMDQIVTSLLNSPVPTAAYVGPTGARAASAGLFVAQAADVVAMAPGTNIGSAHPVTGSGGDIGGDLGRKVLNDAIARIRNLATLHHRNSAWCEQAVRDSVNIGADDAVKIGVADLEPNSLAALLTALDGRRAPRPSGSELTFNTAHASVVETPMSTFERILQALIDPNVAYLLMLVAVFGLIAEVSSPGALLPGVIGGLSAILALVAFSTLPINLGGILLVAFAFLLFLADVKAPTHGVLTVGGLVALLLGSAFLLNTGAVDIGIDWRLIVITTAVIAFGLIFVVRKAIRARSATMSGQALRLVGALGEARGTLDPEGSVFVAGAIWKAMSDSGPIPPGRTVRVTGQDGASLRVESAAHAPSEPAADDDL